MNILALDLGTHCGWATEQKSGVWDLTPKTTESAGERYRKFQDYLNISLKLYDIKYVVYEEVHNHRAVDAAHVYGGLQAILQATCLNFCVEYRGVGVQAIKKHATGNHQAKKDQMIVRASLKFKGTNVIDDNHADALWLYDYATKKLFIPQTPAN